MPGRAIIEIAITNTGGTATIDAIKSQMDALGVSVLSVKESGDQQDKTLQNLLNRLEPARVAAEKLASSQQILKQAFDDGKITQDRYAAALDTLKQKYEQVQSATQSFGSAIEQLAPKLTALLANPIVLATAALAALGKGLEAVSVAAADEELVNAKLSATWTANAGAAGISKERLADLADSLSNLSGVSRDTIKGAEALGLTFSQVTGPMFERMMKDALNMSAVTGNDLNSSLMQLGRALQNPVAGMTTLTRSGVAFTQAVRDQIKAMAESGDEMGAMGMILDQVEGKFKNAAATVGDTTVGSWHKLKTSIEELKESLGGPLLDVEKMGLNKANSTIKDVTEAIDAWKRSLEAFFETIGSGAGVMASLTAFIQGISGGTDEQLRLPAPALNLGAQFDALLNSVNGVDAAGIALFNRQTVEAQAAAEAVKKVAKAYNDELAAYKEISAEIDKRAPLLTSNSYMGILTMSSGVASDMTLGGMGNKAADQFLKDFSSEMNMHSDQYLNPLARDAGSRFGVVMGSMADDGIQQGIEAGILGGLAGSVKFTDKTAGDLSKQFGKAFSDGFMAVFEGKGFKDAWGAVSNGMAGIFSRSLGDMLSALMTGVDSKGNKVSGLTGNNGLLAAGGLWDEDANNGEGGFNWGGAMQMGGGLLSSSAQQSGNKGEGALGGALSGAGMGLPYAAETGGWSIVAGAVIGAVMGYFGTAGPKEYSMNVAAGTTQPANWLTKWQQDTTQGGVYSSTGVSKGGVANTDALIQMSQQVAEKASSTQDSLQELLVVMKQSTIANPAWSATLTDKTGDVSTAFNQFLNNTMPKAVFEAFTPALTTGLEALGVSADRAKNEMEAVANASDFSKAMASLQAYVQALLDFGTETAELQKPLAQLVSDASMGAVQKWAESLATTQTSIGDIFQSFSALSSTDQVSQATQAVALINQQIAANQQLTASLVSAGKQIDQSFQSIFDSITTSTATNKGALALQGYLTSQFTTAFAALQGLNPATSSTEDLTTADQQLQSFAGSLMNLSQTLQGLVPQFDTLNTTFTDLGQNLATGVGKTIAKFGQSTLTTMNQQTADTVAQVEKLRQGLNALDPASDVNTLNQIASLTQQQYANNISELNTILSLEQSINQSITSTMQNWKLQDAQAKGPQAEGDYLVQQIMADYGQLQKGGLTVEQVSSLTSEITSLADTLHGMGDKISLAGPGGQTINTTDWLDQLLQAVDTLAQGQLGNAATGVQSANQKLEDAISGLATYVATDTTALNKAIGDIATLINTDLHGALTTSDALIGGWEGQVVAANAALDKEVNDFVGALTTLTSAAQGAANTLKDVNGIPQTESKANSASAAAKSLDGLGAASDALQYAHVAAAKAVQSLADAAQASGDSLVDSANAFAQIMANAAASAKAAGWA